MVKASSGTVSPVDMAFNDIFEVIQQMEMPKAAQIVPGRDTDSPNNYKELQYHSSKAEIYDSDVSFGSVIKSECTDMKTPCMHSSQFSEWVNMSIHADKVQHAEQFFQPDFSSKFMEDVEWGERLISETKNLFQFPSVHTKTEFAEDSTHFRNYSTMTSADVESLEHPSWFEQPFTEDLFLATKYEPTDDFQDDGCLSENSSDSEVTKTKDDVFDRITEQTPKPWTAHVPRNSVNADRKTQGARRCKMSFKSTGRPRLCQFLLELLNDPEKYSNLIEWLDKDKGVFKFLNSSRVAQEWGTRRNKPKMKYENFARSLRTYIAKGILTKPRSKLVYRFSSM